MKIPIVNLTPHPIRLLRRLETTPGFEVIVEIDPHRGQDGRPAPARVFMRLGEENAWSTPLLGVTVRRCSTPGEITGLPARVETRQPTGSIYGTTMSWPAVVYIVSEVVAQALRDSGSPRDDVFTVGKGPDDLERKDGQVYGSYVLEEVFR